MSHGPGEAARLRREVMSRVAHELRTPLTAVRGALDMIAAGSGGGVAPEAEELLGMARRNAERLVRVVEDCLVLEGLDGGTYELRTLRARAAAIVAAAAERVGAAAASRRVRLEERTDAEGWVAADVPLLARALAHMVDHALAAAPADTTVVVGATCTGEGSVRFTVDAEGVGRAAEACRLGWEPTSTGSDAAGIAPLELMLARAIIERHGGQLGAAVRPGGTTTLWFELPAE